MGFITLSNSLFFSSLFVSRQRVRGDLRRVSGQRRNLVFGAGPNVRRRSEVVLGGPQVAPGVHLQRVHGLRGGVRV